MDSSHGSKIVPEESLELAVGAGLYNKRVDRSIVVEVLEDDQYRICMHSGQFPEKLKEEGTVPKEKILEKIKALKYRKRPPRFIVLDRGLDGIDIYSKR